jgi:hypothetical protein
MDRKSKKVAALAANAQEFLRSGDSAGAEAAYKHAFTEAVRLLGLRHASTRNLLSIYTMCLKGSQKLGEALRYEALYWKTARPESYRLGILFGEVDSDVQDFLQANADLLEDWGRQIAQESRSPQSKWTAGESALHAFKEYLRSLRQHVLELGK